LLPFYILVKHIYALPPFAQKIFSINNRFYELATITMTILFGNLFGRGDPARTDVQPEPCPVKKVTGFSKWVNFLYGCNYFCL